MSIVCRPLAWPSDRAALLALDTAFASDTAFVVHVEPLRFTLEERLLYPAHVKRYAVDWDAVAATCAVHVAERGGAVVGVVATSVEAWNRRAVVGHLYVDAAARGQGVGQALVQAARAWALAHDARCLWVETQHVNAPAIRFYRRQGFTCCGLDTTLYDPRQLPDETAIFLSLPLTP